MRAKRTIAITTALLGLSLVTAGTAAAAPGRWVAFGNDNPILGSSYKWLCAGSKEIGADMVAQVCALRSSEGTGRTVESAVIVRNNGSSLASASAQAVLWKLSGSDYEPRTCASSGVAAHSWSVCFGASWDYGGKVWASGDARNVSLGYTGNI